MKTDYVELEVSVDTSDSGFGSMPGCCENGNELSGNVNVGYFFD
jgi:hypothetical protein